MYKLHLILKYLRKRRIAWVSLVAVCLCTTMVLVVFSVMGGWLRMFRQSARGLTGDVVVASTSLAGFPYYDDMIAEIERLPEVKAAVPTLQTFGLINIDNQQTSGVQVRGIPIERIGLVNEFTKSLFRQNTQWQEWIDGGPIGVDARERLRDMGFGRIELEALAKAAPEITAKFLAEIGALTTQAAAAKDDAERKRLTDRAGELRKFLDHLAAPNAIDSNTDLAKFRSAVAPFAGGAIEDADRRRIIREPLALLKFSDKERKTLTDKAGELRAAATKQIDKFTAKAANSTDPAEQRTQRSKIDNFKWAMEGLRDLTNADRDPETNIMLRTVARELIKDIVDSPEDRLTPNEAERKYAMEKRDAYQAHPSFQPFLPPDAYKSAYRRKFPRAKQALIDEAPTWSGIITGTGVVGLRKDATGKVPATPDFFFRLPVSLTVMGISDSGRIDVQAGKAERPYWIVDTSRTKVWQYDTNTVYVPFDVLQQDLGMQKQTAEKDGKTVEIPGRTSEIQIRLKDGVREGGSAVLMQMRGKIEAAIERVIAEKAKTVGWPGASLTVKTWEQTQAKWLGAIEKELVLVTMLFGIISVVAIFLIFCIFYMIVVEKTRDIGIIKSVGATNAGVAGIFLGYGAAIGIVGAGLGLLFGWLIVTNINQLHDWLGSAMGVQVWDPEVYAFETIPSTMDWPKVWVIVGVAIVASIIGSLVPAIRAARLNPVEALRWE